jgi:hypothetical protein
MTDTIIEPPGRRLASAVAGNAGKKRWGRPFEKGKSGNPGGVPKARENIVDIARQASPKAMRTLIAVMDDKKAPYSVRAFCAGQVMDRAWGKAVQQTNVLVSSNQRPLNQLSDQELMEIIANGRATAALPAPLAASERQPDTIDAQAEPIENELSMGEMTSD